MPLVMFRKEDRPTWMLPIVDLECMLLYFINTPLCNISIMLFFLLTNNLGISSLFSSYFSHLLLDSEIIKHLIEIFVDEINSFRMGS